MWKEVLMEKGSYIYLYKTLSLAFQFVCVMIPAVCVSHDLLLLNTLIHA